MKHQKTLLRTDEVPETPWQVGCSCGWTSLVADEKQGLKLHAEHRKATKVSYHVGRRVAGATVFVKIVPPINGDWGYTLDRNEAALVDEKTKTRYLRHLRASGLTGLSFTVQS